MTISISEAGVIAVFVLLVANGLSVLIRDIRRNRRQPAQIKPKSKGIR
jgi:hypothetical protein